MKCEACIDIDELEKEYPDGITHGAQIICGECNAEYYEEWGGRRWNCNKEAELAHPELKKL